MIKSDSRNKADNTSAQNEPIAIIGMSCLFPKAQSLGEYWSNIKNRVDAITDVPSTHWKVDDYYSSDQKKPDYTYCRRGGFLSPEKFDPSEFGISPATLEAIDTSQLLGLVVAHGALSDAGYGVAKKFDRDRVGVVLGLTGTLELAIPLGARLGHPIWRRALSQAGVEDKIADEVVKNIGNAYVSWQENSFPGLLGNVAAGRIANRLDLGGTNCVVDAACASSLTAIHMASMELETGRADMMITGGVDTFNDIFMYMCFSKTPALSPTHDARPFSADSDGTILGEGIGMLVLKRLKKAEEDGDKIYAVIKGIGTSSDGKGKAIYAPDADGQAKALKRAYAKAGADPRTIEMIEAHGTGTKVGDVIEISALNQVFPKAENGVPWCGVGSVKSMIGHTKAAAGSAGLIKVAMALHNKVLPPTIKISKPAAPFEEKDSPFYLLTDKRPWFSQPTHPRRAGGSSFGFGGSNFHLVVEEYSKEKSSPDWDSNIHLFAVSGTNTGELKKKLVALKGLTSKTDILLNSHKTCSSFSASHSHRLCFAVDLNKSSVDKYIELALTQLEKSGENSFVLPEGVFFSSSAPTGKTAIIFSGQGSQYIEMGRDMACSFPEMFNSFSDANSVLSDDLGKVRLTDYVFPTFTFDKELKSTREKELTSTSIAQPALGAFQMGMFGLLENFGFAFDMAAGHSFGELSALCAAGVFSPSDLTGIARIRGLAMSADQKQKGGMIAVAEGSAQIEKLLKEGNIDLKCANYNSPVQTVLSGKYDEVLKAAKFFESKSVRATVLNVSGAFHTDMLSEASQQFKSKTSSFAFRKPRFKVFSNVSGKAHSDDPEAIRTSLVDQIVNPVRFVDMIENMYSEGARIFIESGPGTRISGLLKAILGNRPHTILNFDASSGAKNGMFDLAKLFAAYSSLGFAVKLESWNNGLEALLKPSGAGKKLTFDICGSNYRSPKANVSSRPTEIKTIKNVQAEKKINSADIQPLARGPEKIETARRLEVDERSVMNRDNESIQKSLPAGLSTGKSDFAKEALKALQSLQQQTAELHCRFLDGQEAAQKSMQSLIEKHFERQYTPVSHRAVSSSPSAAVVAPRNDSFTAVPARPSVPTVSVETQTRHVQKVIPSVAPSLNTVSVRDVLFTAVTEKTGYPAEMLNPDMDMEADLGIDSIKRVEIMSAVQEKMPDLPAIQPDQLGRFRTLNQIISYLAGSEKPTSKIAEPSHEVSHKTDVMDILLTAVCEKTGYPRDMLNPDMDMEADLGIDSIKRVEIMSAVQEKMPELPAIQPDQLGRFKTLSQINAYLSSGSSSSQQSSTEQHSLKTAPEVTTQNSVPSPDVLESLLSSVSEKTGYPKEMLNLDMDMEADLGIDSIKRVEILSAFQEKMPHLPVIQPGDLGKLRTLRQILQKLTPTEENVEKVEKKNREKPEYRDVLKRLSVSVSPLIDGGRSEVKPQPGTNVLITNDGTSLSQELVKKYVKKGFRARLIGFDELDWQANEDVSGLVVVLPRITSENASLPWTSENESIIKDSFRILRQFSASLIEQAEKSGAFLTIVEKFDGCFGFSENDLNNCPVFGSLSGLAKTAAREWPKVNVRVFDIAQALDNHKKLPDYICTESLKRGPDETGLNLKSTSRSEKIEACYLSTGKTSFATEYRSEPILNSEDTVIVTGGAKGVTASVAVEIAAKYSCKMILLGRTDRIEEPGWLKPFRTEEEMKSAIFANSAPKKMTPKELESTFARYKGNREIADTMNEIEKAGGKAYYYSLDIRDKNRTESILKEIQNDHGKVTGLIHGAGVLRDKAIVAKTLDQFEDVFGTKISGLRNILEALSTESLKTMVFFSSSTARFGRIGQSDYSMANEALNKIAQFYSKKYPTLKVVSANWGPWQGGMVNPALGKLFASEGVGLIPLKAGACFLADEINSKSKDVEVVILTSESKTDENNYYRPGENADESTDTAGDQSQSEPQSEPQSETVKEVVSKVQSSADADISPQKRMHLGLKRVLSVDRDFYLSSHLINNEPVLPAALMIELMGHAALHENPGFMFHGLNDFRVTKGIILVKKIPQQISVYTTRVRGSEKFPKVSCEIRSETPRGEIVHAVAEVILAEKLPLPEKPTVSPDLKWVYPKSVEAAYSQILFHGKHLMGIKKVRGWSSDGIAANVLTSPSTDQWMNEPFRSTWVADPLSIDCAFQLMILWTFQEFGMPSLPCFLGSYRQYRPAFPSSGVRVMAKAKKCSQNTVRANIEFVDETGALIASMIDYECVMTASLMGQFRETTSEKTANA
ncbi:MAG: SDR family NAD(P)-dependent oxidoreductase [Candidatus Riflebacteria bacterium]|nr:SDR family NAD(P)-dependent oxidoreductase [Candidatus Riflebacteria bacterium]